jgi:uncharacterized protein YggT (Ycf19 family)
VAPAGEHKKSLVNLREAAAYGSTVFGLACLVKVYGVARYSSSTTAALITTAPEQVILGTLAIYVYPTMAVLAYGTPYVAVLWRRSLPREAWPPVLAVTAVAALMTPLEFHLISLAVLAVSILIEVLIRRFQPAHWAGPYAALRRSMCGRVFAFLGALVLLAGFLDTVGSPWASAEVFVVTRPVVVATQDLASGSGGPVHVASSARPFVGYVIDESLTSYTVLNASTRYIMVMEKSQVADRYTCHSSQEQLRGRQPLLNRLLGRPYLSPNADCTELASSLAAQQPAPPSR